MSEKLEHRIMIEEGGPITVSHGKKENLSFDR